jgi:hypothetical protein
VDQAPRVGTVLDDNEGMFAAGRTFSPEASARSSPGRSCACASRIALNPLALVNATTVALGAADDRIKSAGPGVRAARFSAAYAWRW